MRQNPRTRHPAAYLHTNWLADQVPGPPRALGAPTMLQQCRPTPFGRHRFSDRIEVVQDCSAPWAKNSASPSIRAGRDASAYKLGAWQLVRASRSHDRGRHLSLASASAGSVLRAAVRCLALVPAIGYLGQGRPHVHARIAAEAEACACAGCRLYPRTAI